MSVYDEKNNPPLWLIIVGIIVVCIAVVFVMLAPTKKYTQKNQYYLKKAQSVIVKPAPAEKPFGPFFLNSNRRA